MRKIISLKISPSNLEGKLPWLFALCDDGTLWTKNVRDSHGWELVANVPTFDFLASAIDDIAYKDGPMQQNPERIAALVSYFNDEQYERFMVENARGFMDAKAEKGK